MRLVLGLAGAALLAAMPSSASAQGVDYHKAQQAGKVWERKQAERNRKPGPRVNSAGVPHDAPFTAAEREAGLARYRSDYDELLRSVGKKNADRWLLLKMRIDRSKL